MRTLTPIFSIIIAFVVFFSVTRPMFAEIKIVQDETQEYEKAVNEAEALNQKLKALIAAKNQFSDIQREALEMFVPSSIDEVRILNDLKGIATTNRMLLGNVKVSEETMLTSSPEGESARAAVSYDNLVSSDISFALIGTYDQFKAMLRDMERSLVLMEVTNITFTASEGDLMQFEVTARVFALPETATPETM